MIEFLLHPATIFWCALGILIAISEVKKQRAKR